jgi:DNA-binding NarL/FixJ family response regulator
MSETLNAVIIDALTGITVEREFSPDEIEQHELDVANALAQQAEQEAKAAARESALAKLADLGLTAEEIAAL